MEIDQILNLRAEMEPIYTKAKTTHAVKNVEKSQLSPAQFYISSLSTDKLPVT